MTEEAKPKRTEKQIAWSKELGKRSKILKEHKNKSEETPAKTNYYILLAAAGVGIVCVYKCLPTKIPDKNIKKVEEIENKKSATSEMPKEDTHIKKQIPTILQMK